MALGGRRLRGFPSTQAQPPPTPPISYGGMLLSAIGLVGLIVLTAFIVGGIIGAVIIIAVAVDKLRQGEMKA